MTIGQLWRIFFFLKGKIKERYVFFIMYGLFSEAKKKGTSLRSSRKGAPWVIPDSDDYENGGKSGDS
jgi:hypothetical protein